MILDDIMPPFLKPFSLFEKFWSEMTKKGSGSGKGRGAVSRAVTDAEEAMNDARAEIADVADAVETGEPSGDRGGKASSVRPELPAGLLQRRLDAAKSDAEKAIKEKEAMQKKLDDMQAELELAKTNIGDVVPVAQNPVVTPARKVCLDQLETGFDLGLNLDVCVLYLIQFCRRSRKQWQLWPQF